MENKKSAAYRPSVKDSLWKWGLKDEKEQTIRQVRRRKFFMQKAQIRKDSEVGKTVTYSMN